MHDSMPERLAAFLAAEDPRLGSVEVVDYEPIAGGLSRVMARFTIKHTGGSERMILRADPPKGRAAWDTDRSAEWELIRHLAAEGGVPLPAARYFDPDGGALGSPAIVLEAIDSRSLISTAREGDAAARRHLAARLADLAAAVHLVPVARLPARMARPTAWNDYIDQRIAAWAASERSSASPDPFMRYVGAWLGANRPPPAPLTLVHGDFQISNILVGGRGDFSLVDWEFGHVGDPREDLGWFRLAGATMPPDLIGEDDAEFCARYRKATGFAEGVVTPATVAYFTVLGSLQVFAGMRSQAASLAEAKVGATPIAYTVLCQSFIHQVWMGAVRTLSAARPGENAP